MAGPFTSQQLEDLEDAQIVRDAMARLKAAGGDPEAAGMTPWEQAQAELNVLERDKAAA